MARVVISDSDVIKEPRRVKLSDINPGRAVRIDNPDGEVSFYIVNKVPDSERLQTKPNTITLTNFGSGRIVQKRANMLAIPVSAEVFIGIFPEMSGNK